MVGTQEKEGRRIGTGYPEQKMVGAQEKREKENRKRVLRRKDGVNPGQKREEE